MNSYSRSKSKTRKFDNNTFINKVNDDTASLDLLEANQNGFEAGSFSSTTSMDGKLEAWIGSVDGGNEIGGHEAVEIGYAYTMNLNTSFSGDDNKTEKKGDIGKIKKKNTKEQIKERNKKKIKGELNIENRWGINSQQQPLLLLQLTRVILLLHYRKTLYVWWPIHNHTLCGMATTPGFSIWSGHYGFSLISCDVYFFSIDFGISLQKERVCNGVKHNNKHYYYYN
jgi:hypothetical protein